MVSCLLFWNVQQLFIACMHCATSTLPFSSRINRTNPTSFSPKSKKSFRSFLLHQHTPESGWISPSYLQNFTFTPPTRIPHNRFLAMDSFLDFPLEIQILIWQQAISAEKPRNVEVRSKSLVKGGGKCCVSAAKIPPLLHACQKSRMLSMERWSLSFPEVRDWRGEPVTDPLARIVRSVPSTMICFTGFLFSLGGLKALVTSHRSPATRNVRFANHFIVVR